jgi:UPF0755 protein
MSQLLYRLVALTIMLGSFILGWHWLGYQQFLDSPIQLTEGEQTLLIEPGDSLRGVARDLARDGVISDELYFRVLARLSGKAAKIQAGEYLLSGTMTPEGLLQQLVEGRVKQYGLTLIEGWRFGEMLDFIKASPDLHHTLSGVSPEEIMAEIGLPDIHPEGRFLPDTYHFPRGMSDRQFLLRAYQTMVQFLGQAWAERDETIPLKSPYEALILASIVEKETGKASERAEIAGVFSRRLQQKMRLQTDPTVIYGLGEAFDGNIKRRHLSEDNPYNTYTRHGLPPTPIALPGREAILAALHPAAGDAIYFVSKGDGSHHFSATLEEHNNAVIKYQLNGRKKSFSSYKDK